MNINKIRLIDEHETAFAAMLSEINPSADLRMTWKETAEALGVPVRTLEDWRAGRRRPAYYTQVPIINGLLQIKRGLAFRTIVHDERAVVYRLTDEQIADTIFGGELSEAEIEAAQADGMTREELAEIYGEEGAEFETWLEDHFEERPLTVREAINALGGTANVEIYGRYMLVADELPAGWGGWDLKVLKIRRRGTVDVEIYLERYFEG